MGSISEIALPTDVPGKLFRSPMPGRYRELSADIEEIESAGINLIVCLAEEKEIQRKSPEYLQWQRSNSQFFSIPPFPIADYKAPDKKRYSEYAKFIEQIAESLLGGKRILIHCGAGKGRTGMVAICVLMKLGLSLNKASEVVQRAGACPEEDEQRELIRWYEQRLES